MHWFKVLIVEHFFEEKKLILKMVVTISWELTVDECVLVFLFVVLCHF